MKDDIDACLAELRELLEQARSMPMSASVMVNKADLLSLVDRLESTIDQTLTQASDVVGTRDAVVAEGHSEAAEIRRQAETERERLVSDTEVYKLAQQRADEERVSAKRDAEELRTEADGYVESTLANFELTLERTLAAVKRGRARLTEGHASGLADDSDVADIELPEHLRRK